MDLPASSPGALETLRQHWRAFGLMAVLYARALLARPREGAHVLQLCLFVAVAEINRQIAAAEAGGETLSEEEAYALSHLKAISLSLLALALILQMAGLAEAGQGAGWRAAGFAGPQLALCWHVLAGGPLRGVPFLDSG